MAIILIFIFICLFMFCFIQLTNKYVNPYKLIMVFGKKGSGKTTFLTKVAISYLKQGYKVYSTIYIPGTVLFDVNDIGKFTFDPESVVLIDEVGMIWDNRDFKNFRSDVRDFFKFQRQYKLRMYLFSQTFDIDLKLRNLTDEMYLLKNVCRVWSVARRIDKRITIQHGDEGKASTLVDDYTFAPLLAPSSYIITFIPRWVSYFQSYSPKELPFIKGTPSVMSELQLRYMDTRLWLFDTCDKIFISVINKSKVIFDDLKNRARSLPYNLRKNKSISFFKNRRAAASDNETASDTIARNEIDQGA